MNEELQKVLTEMLNKASSGIDATKTFLESEIPEVVTQLLLWHGIKNFIYFCIGVLLLIIVAYIVVKVTRVLKENSSSNGIFFLAPAFILCLIAGSTINITWLQIWIAPKIFIIEYIASLAK